MASRSEKKVVTAPAMSASPREVTRDGEVTNFEKLLSDLSAAFIRVSVEDIDHEIERRLEQIVLALDIDSRGRRSSRQNARGVY